MNGNDVFLTSWLLLLIRGEGALVPLLHKEKKQVREPFRVDVSALSHGSYRQSAP